MGSPPTLAYVLLIDRSGPFGAAARPGFALAAAAALAAAGCPTLLRLEAEEGEGWASVGAELGLAMAATAAQTRRALESSGLALSRHLPEGTSALDLVRAPEVADAAAGRSELIVHGAEGRVDPWVDRPTRLEGRRPDGRPALAALDPKAFGLQLMQPASWPAATPETVAGLQRTALGRKRTPESLAVRLLAGAILDHTGRASTIMRGVGRIHAVLHNGAARGLLAT